MHLKLFEVAGTHIFSMSAIVMVLFFVFAIIVVGYLLGKINIKGVSLGTAAIFLVALVVGHFRAWHSAKTALPPGLQMWRHRTQSTFTLSSSRALV